MKKKHFFLLMLVGVGLASCKKDKKEQQPDQIESGSLNKEYVLDRNVEKARSGKDEVSLHVDSILSGLINAEFVSTGLKSFDLNNDNRPDINFEIIDLTKYNAHALPDSFDNLAARAQPLTVEILDNSGFRYPDALSANETISGNGVWTSETGVLGTFLNAGRFQGKGEKYLGFRFYNNNKYNYGWIKLSCSQHSDTLRIIEFAYNKTEGNSIKAGQK